MVFTIITKQYNLKCDWGVLKMREEKSKLIIYVHRTDRMRDTNKKKFLKSERPRIEVSLRSGKSTFMYADEFSKFITDNFEYGDGV